MCNVLKTIDEASDFLDLTNQAKGLRIYLKKQYK